MATGMTSKKIWETPALNVHGDVAEITQGQKTIGRGDGYVLIIANIIAVPIQDYPKPS